MRGELSRDRAGPLSRPGRDRRCAPALADWHGVDPAQVFAANGSNEVLQTLLLDLRRSRAARSLMFEPTYPLHAHIARITGTGVVEGERPRRLHARPARSRRVVAEHEPAVVFLCSPNNPTGLVEPPATVDAAARRVAPGCVVVDEAYGEFADWTALELVADDAPLVVVRTYSKVWSLAASRLGFVVGPAWVVAELEKVVLPYHLDAAKQIAGRLALRLRRRDGRARRADRRGAGAASARRSAAMAVDVFPSGANFVLFRPRRRPGTRCGRACRPRRARARLLALAAARRLPAGHRRHARENDAFLAALGGGRCA